MRPWHSKWGDGSEFSETEILALRQAYTTAGSRTVFGKHLVSIW